MSDKNEGVIFGLSAVAVALLSVALVVGIILVGWAFGGWFQVHDAQRQIKINNIKAHGIRHGYEYQQTQRQAVTGDYEAVRQVAPQMFGQSEGERQALGDQRLSELGTLCSDAATVDISTDPLPPAQTAFVAANCTGGTVNPSSSYETRKDQPTP